jgi:DNA polymerase III delta prime subunit
MMDMPISLSDFVISQHEEQMPKLRAYVEGKRSFPSTHSNTLLLHGIYGSGKTLLASILPILFEYHNATPQVKREYDFCYRYGRELLSITPSNVGKKALSADITLVGCGGESASEKQKIISKIRELQRCSTLPFVNEFRFFIFDEVDEWNSTQSDLKSLITNAHANSIFILTTNFRHKLDNGLRSRSIEFEMNRVEPFRLVPIIRKYHPFLSGISDDSLINLIAEGNTDWRKIKRLIEDVEFQI